MFPGNPNIYPVSKTLVFIILDLSFLEFHINGIKVFMLLFLDPLLSKMFEIYLYHCVYEYVIPFCCYVVFVVYVYHNLFIQLAVDKNLSVSILGLLRIKLLWTFVYKTFLWPSGLNFKSRAGAYKQSLMKNRAKFSIFMCFGIIF